MKMDLLVQEMGLGLYLLLLELILGVVLESARRDLLVELQLHQVLAQVEALQHPFLHPILPVLGHRRKR